LAQIKQDIVNLKPVEHLAILHTRCEQVARNMARGLAEKLEMEPHQVLVAETGPVLASHGGPNLLGAIAIPASPRTGS
jgi:hypothetical protein